MVEEEDREVVDMEVMAEDGAVVEATIEQEMLDVAATTLE